MADYNANVIEFPSIYTAIIDPRGEIPAVKIAGFGASAFAVSNYLMRGWRPGTSDYEYWTAIGSPNTDNPSGQPIVDITVIASWEQ